MKTLLFIFLFAAAFAIGAAEPRLNGAADAPAPTPAASVSLDKAGRLPGVALAEGVSEITGAAISPLLGVSAIGAWRYYHTPEAMRKSLPWFCHPGFWGTGFGILALCFLKDVLGAFMPAVMKKPFDMAELFESKFSALVASAAFVPLIAAQMAQQFPAAPQTSFADSGAALPLAVMGFDFYLLFVPLCVLAFLVVWMAAHAINVLIALCPFGLIDTMLKLVKTALLGVILVPYTIHPYLGLGVSLLIILVAALLAPAAFRLIVFGTLFATDTIVPARARRRVTPAKAHAFAGTSAGVPSRTYGQLVRAPDGTLHFSFRPWLILPRRTISLPAGTLALSKGVFYPSLLHSTESPAAFRRIILFLPRYRTHEDALAAHLEILEIRDSALTKGFKAVRAWLSEIGNLGKGKYPETQQLKSPP